MNTGKITPLYERLSRDDEPLCVRIVVSEFFHLLW